MFSHLGPYRLQERLGQGGMGAVYAAVHEETGERVAVKLLAPGLGDDEHFRDRFAVEIETLRTLHHRNIVQLLGFGRHQGQLYYVMERVEGKSLQSELQEGRRYTWREVVEIGLQVCAALKHAHDHGVVHRDLKPGNLLRTTDGVMKLADFGIAKLFGGTQLTATGGTLGTADFMAPEQADGQPVGPRGDLYSLGSVLFTLLAGRPPFQGKSLPQLIHQVRFQEPPLVRPLAPGTPVELEAVIGQLLAKDPQERIPTARALAVRLESVLEEADRAPEETFVPPPVNPTGPPAAVPQAAAPSTRTAPAESAPPNVAAERAAAEPEPADLFVSVPPRNRERPPAEPSAVPIRTLLAAALVLLAVMVTSLWYALRPPTADQLLLQIQTQRDRNGPARSESLEKLVAEFLERFPEDPRARELAPLQEEFARLRFERELLRELEEESNGESPSPIQPLLRDAMRIEPVDPAEAAQRYRAILDLFTDRDDELSQRCLDLASNRLERLNETAERLREEHLEQLLAELSKAAGLLAAEPAEGRRRLEAIITLYGREPWAAEPVAEAHKLLAAGSSESE